MLAQLADRVRAVFGYGPNTNIPLPLIGRGTRPIRSAGFLAADRRDPVNRAIKRRNDTDPGSFRASGALGRSRPQNVRIEFDAVMRR